MHILHLECYCQVLESSIVQSQCICKGLLWEREEFVRAQSGAKKLFFTFMTQGVSLELIPEQNMRANWYFISTSVPVTLQGRDSSAGKTTTIIYIFYFVLFLFGVC